VRNARSLLLSLLLALAATPAPRTEETSGGVLFVTSDPPGAAVILDGTRLDRATPVLVRGLAAGEHRVEISRPGYAAYAGEVTLGLSAPEVVSPSLPRTGFVAAAPGADVTIPGSDKAAAGSRLALPLGTYTFSRDASRRLSVAPVYPRQRLVDALAVGIPLFLGFATYITVESGGDPGMPPAAIASYATAATMIGAEAWLLGDRRRFREETALQAEAEGDAAAEQAAFDLALCLLVSDRFPEALAALDRIDRGSRLYPQALYKRASIHLLNGAYAAALADFDLIVRDYPLPDLYDRSLKAAADVLVEMGQYPEALDRLDRMVFLDVLYGHEEIDRYRCQVLSAWSARAPQELPRAIEAYFDLVASYAASPRIDTYRLELASLLITAGRRREGLEQIQAVLAHSRDEGITAQARALERSLAIPP
jgi:tetratricopeptide (TPR) repeat protein